MPKIVVNLDKAEYERLQAKDWKNPIWANPLEKAIHNGTVLPKGHGDLITKEQTIELVEFYQMNPQHFDFVNLIDEIKDEKAVIKAESEDK